MPKNRAIRWSLFGLLTISLATLTWILVDGLNDDRGSSEIGVILGGKVYPSGVVSDYLAARLDHGQKLFSEGRVQQLLVSGGVGKEGHDEAVVMRDYLVGKGVPSDRIIVDSNGVNTRKTAEFAAVELAKLEADSVVVISQYFHIARCKLAFSQAGIGEVSGSAPWYFQWRDLFSAPREVVGIWAYLLRLR